MTDFIRNNSLIKRKYREFFLPTIAMALSYSLTTIVDGIIVSIFLGADQMAAVNTCIPIPQLNATIATLIGIGSSTLISIAKGRREKQTADRLPPVFPSPRQIISARSNAAYRRSVPACS